MSALIESRPVVRVAAWDRFRGAAIVFMLIDHLARLAGPEFGVLRIVPGRLAMPMFFLLAGYLARSPRWRHAAIGWLGIALPFFVPWIDTPNVLVLWAVGVVILWAWRRAALPMWLLAAIGLGWAANGYSIASATSYEPVAMVGLMALGAMLPASAFAWARDLPSWAGWIGRHPIAWYAGHLLILQLAIEAV